MDEIGNAGLDLVEHSGQKQALLYRAGRRVSGYIAPHAHAAVSCKKDAFQKIILTGAVSMKQPSVQTDIVTHGVRLLPTQGEVHSTKNRHR